MLRGKNRSNAFRSKQLNEEVTAEGVRSGFFGIFNRTGLIYAGFFGMKPEGQVNL